MFMKTSCKDPTTLISPGTDDFRLDPSDVIEIPLLLPGWQMSAIEQAAFHRGMTAAEMVRHLLNDFLAAEPS
jgi:hypothetical protein